MVGLRFVRLAIVCATLLLSTALLDSRVAAAQQASGEVTVVAAASLTDAFREIAVIFQYENPDAPVTFSFGSSSTLRTQLDQGASADVFASADEAQMNMAQQNGDLSGEPQVFAHNLLSIVVPADNPRNIQGVCDLARPGVKFVTTQPTVPVGIYTEQMLVKAAAGECGAGYDDQVRNNVVSREADVRQLVAKVQLGEADAGVSYLTDVTPQVRNAVSQISVPDELNVLATYPIATAKGTNLNSGQAFMNFVLSPIGQAVLNRWGFLPPRTPTANPARVPVAMVHR
jgi:molybdate transport system substrate-binding protein